MTDKIEILINNSISNTIEDEQGDIKNNSNESVSLYGIDGIFDSIGLVTFLIELEQKIEDEFDKSITIADEKAMSMKNSPFRSIPALSDYIIDKLK